MHSTRMLFESTGGNNRLILMLFSARKVRRSAENDCSLMPFLARKSSTLFADDPGGRSLIIRCFKMPGSDKLGSVTSLSKVHELSTIARIGAINKVCFM